MPNACLSACRYGETATRYGKTATRYGKTAISLGLIDASPKAPPMEPRFEGKAIAVKATLIIVPKHLMKQWPSELAKFLGSSK